MTHNNYIYIAVMALVSYAIRILPLTLIRKPIKNRFVQSFLYYVPYVTLAVMTFPAIVQATQSPVAGAVALVIGIAAAWCGASLFQVAVACCAVVSVTSASPAAARKPRGRLQSSASPSPCCRMRAPRKPLPPVMRTRFIGTISLPWFAVSIAYFVW